MSLSFWLMPIVGGDIGWVTNLIAIRMLFRPRRPIRIPLLGVTVHGLLPSRQEQLAQSIGRAVAEEIISLAEVLDRVDIPGLREELVAAVSRHVEERLQGSMARLLPSQWRAALVGYVQDVVARETGLLMDSLIERVRGRVEETIDLEALVAEKILALNLDELEALVIRLAGRELRAIVVLGAVLGFLIGLGQMGLTLLLLRASNPG